MQETQLGDGNTQLSLQRLYEKPGAEVWEAVGQNPLKPGQFVFVEHGTLSYFDEELMQVARFSVGSLTEVVPDAISATGGHPHGTPQAQTSGGGCLVTIGLGMLLFLAVSIDNPTNKTSEGVEAGMFLLLFALVLLSVGLYRRLRGKKNKS